MVSPTRTEAPPRDAVLERAAPSFPNLFSSIKIGGMTAKNRIMRVATTSNLAQENRVGARMLAFYETVADGGAGVIVSEATRVHPTDSVTPGAIPLFDRGVIPGLRRITDVIHRNDALFIAQLNHGGRQHLGRRIGTLIAPSAIACPRSGGTPHALTTREVEEMVEWYISAAVTAREAGADGVEVHGAQGHLIGQFASPYSNRREDRYGGSLENRLRFARDILEGVRRRLGPRAVIGYRLGVEEFTEGGLDIDDTCEIAAALKEDGIVDYLSLSQGNFNSIETHLPDRHWPQMVYRPLQRQIKAAVGDLAVVQSTRITGPEQAEDIIASGDGDMVGLCRALIVDPEWPKKAQSGRSAEIRRCISCNQCWDWISTGEPIACATNAVAGREHHFGKLTRAARGKILVVGGGPAGLETARIAAERGHDVVVIERAAQLGGKFVAASRLPNNAELGNLTAYLETAVKRKNIDIRLGITATAEIIMHERPTSVVIAAGAEPLVPTILNDGTVPVTTAVGPDDIEKLPHGAKNIILMDEDGYYWGSGIAEALAILTRERGQILTVCTRFFELFRELPMVSRIASLRLLDKHGARLRPLTSINEARNGGVALTHTLTGRIEIIEDAAALVWIGVQSARHTLYDTLRSAGLDRTFIIGDAYAPRRLASALLEAHSLARTI